MNFARWRDIRTVCRQNIERVVINNKYCNSHPTIDKYFQELMTVKNQEYYEQLFGRILMSLHWMNSDIKVDCSIRF